MSDIKQQQLLRKDRYFKNYLRFHQYCEIIIIFFLQTRWLKFSYKSTYYFPGQYQSKGKSSVKQCNSDHKGYIPESTEVLQVLELLDNVLCETFVQFVRATTVLSKEMNLVEAWETVVPANLVQKFPAEQILARGRVDIAEHGVKPLDSQAQVLWEKFR